MIDAGPLEAGCLIDAGPLEAGCLIDAGPLEAGCLIDAGPLEAGCLRRADVPVDEAVEVVRLRCHSRMRRRRSISSSG